MVPFVTKEKERRGKERRGKEKKNGIRMPNIDKHSNTLYIVCFRFRLLAAVLTDKNAIEEMAHGRPKDNHEGIVLEQAFR